MRVVFADGYKRSAVRALLGVMVMMIVVMIFVVIGVARCRRHRLFGLRRFTRATGQKKQSAGNERNVNSGCVPNNITEHKLLHLLEFISDM
jgi:hypothetical protein